MCFFQVETSFFFIKILKVTKIHLCYLDLPKICWIPSKSGPVGGVFSFFTWREAPVLPEFLEFLDACILKNKELVVWVSDDPVGE